MCIRDLFFFSASSIVIEEARTKSAIFFKYTLRKQKEKTKLLFIQTNTNLFHIERHKKKKSSKLSSMTSLLLKSSIYQDDRLFLVPLLSLLSPRFSSFCFL